MSYRTGQVNVMPFPPAWQGWRLGRISLGERVGDLGVVELVRPQVAVDVERGLERDVVVHPLGPLVGGLEARVPVGRVAFDFRDAGRNGRMRPRGY